MLDNELQPRSYEVEIDGEKRRINRVDTARHEPTIEDETYLHLADRLLGRTEPRRPPVGILGLIWRLLVRVLEKLGPTDPPHVIAVIRAPERMYCVDCGTQRVARYCPICGRDVDRQYRRLVRRMARYVVDGTADYRNNLEEQMQAEMEQQVSQLRKLQTEMLRVRLARLERDCTMELARQEKQLRAMTQALAREILLEELKRVRAEDPMLALPAGPGSSAGSTSAPSPRPRRGR